MAMIWICVPMFLFLFLRDKRYVLPFMMSLFIFGAGFFLQTKETIPEWVDTIIVVPKLFGPTNNKHALAQRVGHVCKQVIARYPSVEIIIFPEGSLYCKNLARNQSLAAHWSGEKLGKKVHIILGAFHQEGDALYNSLQWFYDGKFVQMHHKQHVLPITEQLPWWLSFSWFKNAYFSNISEIVPAYHEKKSFVISDTLSCNPFICSEFFCTNAVLQKNTGEIPLVVCIDSLIRSCVTQC